MGNTALKKAAYFEEGFYHQGPPLILRFPDRSSLASKSVLPLFILLTCIQILDGVLTISGIYTYGSSIEGNPLLQYFMQSVDAYSPIIFAKVLAIGIIWFLYSVHEQVSWLIPSLRLVGGVYILAALIPWTYILLQGVLR